MRRQVLFGSIALAFQEGSVVKPKTVDGIEEGEGDGKTVVRELILFGCFCDF